MKKHNKPNNMMRGLLIHTAECTDNSANKMHDLQHITHKVAYLHVANSCT